MSLPNYENALMTYLAGITFSFTDRLFSKNAKRFTEERVAGKEERIKALDYLFETEKSSDRIDAIVSKKYYDAVLKAREHFEDNGISFESDTKGLRGKFGRIAENIRYYKDHERVNNLKRGKQFAFACGLEFLADFGVLFSQITLGVGHIGRAFVHTLYQGPALFFGMQTGKGILYAKDLISKSKYEKKLDKLAAELTADGKLLQIVENYSPTAQLKVVEARVIEGTEQVLESGTEQLPAKADSSFGEKATALGEKVGTSVAETVEGIGKGVGAGIDAIIDKYTKRKAAKAEAEKQAREEADEERRQKTKKALDGY